MSTNAFMFLTVLVIGLACGVLALCGVIYSIMLDQRREAQMRLNSEQKHASRLQTNFRNALAEVEIANSVGYTDLDRQAAERRLQYVKNEMICDGVSFWS